MTVVPLGEGGMARVFAARHGVTAERVALKVAKTGEVAAGALRREVRLLSALRHRGLPALVAADESASPPWVAMAWIEGRHTLRSHLRGEWAAGALGPHWEEARRAMADLCAALAYLHARGIAHRDVTPENVLLAPGGGALLADLGMARAFDACGKEPLEVAGVVEGALGYMAPEQICGDRVDGRADLYALGCILHEVICGRPPFEGTPGEILRRHLHDPPPSMGRGASPELEEIVHRCLAKDPRDRPASAEEVAAALGHPMTGRPPFHRPALVGRSGVLAAGAHALDVAKVGRTALLLLVGEPGAGKTRCLSELADSASRSGFRVIASASQPGQGAPLDALRPAIEAVLAAPALLATEDLEVLRRYVQLAAPAGSVQQRWQVESALRQGIAGLSRAQPLLLVLDDLQWADEISVAALAALGEDRLSGGRVALAGACRTHEGSACRERLGSAGWTVHALAGLSHGEVQSLAQEMLSGRAVPPELMLVLERHAGGNPFFVSEYIRMALAERVLSRDLAGRWRVDGGAEAARGLPVPGSLRELLQHAMERLSPFAYTAAEIASVAGRAVDRALVKRLWDLPEEAMSPALRELRDGGVLEEEGELRFRHDVFREVVMARISGDRRRALHRGCALALESRGAEADPRIAGAMANHWEAAGEPLRACDYLERAGRHALALGACGDAIAAFQRALEIGSGAAAERRALWMGLAGEACMGQADHERARAQLTLALQMSGMRVPRSRLGWWARLIAAVLSQTVLRRWRPRASNPPHALRAASHLAECLFFLQELPAFAACSVWCVDLAERSRQLAPAVQYARLGFLAGLPRLRRLARRYFERAQSIGEGAEAALVYEGMSLGIAGDPAASRDMLDLAVTRLRARRATVDLHHALGMRAIASYLAGHYEEAVSGLRELHDGERSGRSLLREWVLCAEAGCLTALGRHAEAVDLLEEALSLARAAGDAGNQLLASGQLGFVVMLCGDHERALALVRSAMELSARKPYSLQGVLGGYRGACQVLLSRWERLGPPDAELERLARRAVRLLVQCLRRYPVGAAGALRCAGWLEWLSGQRRRAVALWEKGLRKCRKASMQLDEALLHHELARPGASRAPAFHERRAGEIVAKIGCAAHLAAVRSARSVTAVDAGCTWRS